MSVDHQQTARVNVDNQTWRTFRILALEAERSIADYLGQLVVHELRRARRRKPQPDPADDSPVEARPEPEPRRKGRSIRLATPSC